MKTVSRAKLVLYIVITMFCIFIAGIFKFHATIILGNIILLILAIGLIKLIWPNTKVF